MVLDSRGGPTPQTSWSSSGLQLKFILPSRTLQVSQVPMLARARLSQLLILSVEPQGHGLAQSHMQGSPDMVLDAL